MATFKEQIDSLKTKLAEAEGRLAGAEAKAAEYYKKGMQEAIEFDREMDTFLIKFLRRDDSSVIVFVIALGLFTAGGVLGYWAHGLS